MSVDLQRLYVPGQIHIDPELLAKAEKAKADRQARTEALERAIRVCGSGVSASVVVDTARQLEAYVKGEEPVQPS